MKLKRTSVQGISGHVFKDLKRPLEQLVEHPDVKKITTGPSFPSHGNRNGFEVGTYDETRHILNVKCYTSNGGQLLRLSVSQNAVSGVTEYIAELNGP